MDTTDLMPLVEDLDANITDLEESLQPLLTTALSASTSKLPLLDKAKLYVLTTYAIESLLFSYLRLNGVDAKNHPVFQELTRVKHYFDKLKTAELGPVKPTQRLDKGAAGRFIKAGLAGNDEYDRQRRDMQDRERAGAKRKFEDMTERVGRHTRFETTAKKIKGDDEEALANEEPEDNQEEDAELKAGASESSSSKRKRPTAADTKNSDDGAVKKSKKKRSKLELTDPASSPANSETILPKRQKSNKAPKGASEAFQALLKGPIEKEDESKKKKKRKSRG